MSSVLKKKVTVKSDIWFLDKNVVQSIGYHQSSNFGTKSTQFFLSAEKQLHYYNLYLYLAICKEDKIHVDGKLLSEKQNPPTSELLYNGEISFDKTKKILISSWKDSFFISTEITFEDFYIATPKITQQKHNETLCSQLAILRGNTNSADITLVTTVDGREFSAHKWILAFRSTVFAAMFQNSEYKENQKNRVEITDVTGEVMDALLKYIYSANVEGVEKIADDLLQAADKYDIALLVEVCVQSLLENLTIDTAAKFFYLTDLYNLEDTKKYVIAFIAGNRRAVRNSAGWTEYIGHEQIQQLYDSML